MPPLVYPWTTFLKKPLVFSRVSMANLNRICRAHPDPECVAGYGQVRPRRRMAVAEVFDEGVQALGHIGYQRLFRKIGDPQTGDHVVHGPGGHAFEETHCDGGTQGSFGLGKQVAKVGGRVDLMGLITIVECPFEDM